MLEVIRDYFKLTPEQVFRHIQGIRGVAEAALEQKGISYDRLRSALVPAQDRREIALIFDSLEIQSTGYGYEVMKRVVPLFEKKGNHSVLTGDYCDRGGQSAKLFRAFESSVELRRDVTFKHPSQFFIVYINNLTDAMVRRLDQGLEDYAGYVGLADVTYGSTFKVYLSTMLTNDFIKHGGIVLQGHEPDRPANEDVNMSAYPFEESGYICRSVSNDLMGVLLSYKIERPVFPGFEADTEFALNAVSPTPMTLEAFDIQVAEAKLDYVKTHKSASVKRAGLEMITPDQLASLIRAKISSNYIYSMGVDQTQTVTKFNVIIELSPLPNGRPTRLLAGLEYQPQQRVLRLITLF